MPDPPTLLEQLAEMERRERVSPPYPLYRKPNPELFKVLAKLREVVEAGQEIKRSCEKRSIADNGRNPAGTRRLLNALAPMKES